MTEPWRDAAREVPIQDVLQALGIAVGREQRLSRCPACGHEGGRSCRLRPGPAGWFWHCFGCAQGGDGLHAVRLIHHGDWSAVRDWYASRGWCGGVTASSTPRVAPAPAAPPVPAAVRSDYPPPDQLAALLAACRPALEDPAVLHWLVRRLCGDAMASEWHARRAAHYLLALPTTAACPDWASYGTRSWAGAGYRAIIPLYDALGQCRSVRARRISGGAPKALPPRGHATGGLVMASPGALALLRGHASSHRRLYITEGEPRYLAWCAAGMDVVGIYSGAWTPGHAARVPALTSVVVDVDRDDAGDRYYAAVRDSLPSHEVYRWAAPNGEAT